MRPVNEYLTAKQVAQMLQISEATVTRWARIGELPVVRLPGRTVRFRREDVEAFLARSA